MKKILFALSMLCLGTGIISSRLEAMENSLSREEQLFRLTCEKMGMNYKEIDFEIGEITCSRSGVFSLVKPKVILSYSHLGLPKNQQAFILAHELAHIKNKDTYKKIGVAVCGCVVLDMLFRNIMHFDENNLNKQNLECMKKVLECITSSVFTLSYFTKRTEKRADLMAITSLKDRTGAIDYFTRECQVNKVRRLHGIPAEFPIDELGNNSSYMSAHPLLTERIAYCESCPL